MEVAVLGPLIVRDDNHQNLPISAGKERAVISALALEHPRSVTVERIIDLVWGELAPVSVQLTLRSLISRLRSRVGASVLVSESSGRAYRLDVSPVEVDASRFTRAVGRARAGAAQGAWSLTAREASAALQEWRAEPLIDLSDSAAVSAERSRLAEARLAAADLRCDAFLATGRHADVVSDLRGYVADYPFHERFWAQLMLALYRGGRQSDALAAYQQARTVLAQELGLEPGPELRELESAILNQDRQLLTLPPSPQPSPPLTASTATPPVSPDGVAQAVIPPAASLLSAVPSPETNLLRPVSSLTGREADLGWTTTAVQQRALVTLTGPGGVGKTRLATQAGLAVLDAFPDGVWLVDLSTTDSPASVVNLIANAMGISLQAGREPLTQLAEAVSERHTLVILDNCEHLATAAASAAQALSRSTAVHVLTTSRELLGIDGELVHTVTPLEVTDAVTLFADRCHGGASDPAQQQVIAQICRRLDGLPLAIELAAANTLLRTPSEILELLTQGELQSGPTRRDWPDRHRDLRTVVEASYRLLSTPARTLFNRLSVFAGDAELLTITRVCGRGFSTAEVEQHLWALVAGSMVVATPHGARTRFKLLETMRTFARRWLFDDSAERKDTELRHSDWTAELVRDADLGLRSPQERQWYDRLDLEFDEIRLAFDQAIGREDQLRALHLVGSLQHYAIFRVRPELFAMALRVAENPRTSGEPVGRALALAAWAAFASLDLRRALTLADRALEHGTSTYTAMVTISMQATAVAMLGDGARGRQIFAELLDRARRSGEVYWIAFLIGFGMACTAAGIDLGAAALLEEGLAAATASGVPSLHAFLAVGQGYVAASTQPLSALAHLRRGAALANAAGCTYLRDYALSGLTALDARPLRRDLPHLVTEAQRWLEAGDHFQVLVHVLNIADGLQADGRTEAAQRLRTAASDPLTAAHDKLAAFHRVVALAAHLTAPASAPDARATAQGA